MPRYDFTPAQIADMAARHRAGVPSNHMAEDFGCSGQTITRLLKLHGVWDPSLRYTSKHTAADKEAMVARYLEGESLGRIAADFGCAAGNVRWILLKRGVELRKTGRPPIPQETLDFIRTQREEGVSYQRIGDTLGVSEYHVMATCRRMGLPLDPRKSGAAHTAWKGGRVVHGSGYVMVWLSPEDPLYCMTTSLGYVVEHRLVMARSIGRPLTRTETVHHINGDRTDNRLENLQLRQGAHGKGSVMQCHDCGSHNVGHVPIADAEPA